ncbi:MAG: T9SS type A sorting domain-containing protein [Crocinitomicaceae bacterium]
MLLILFVSVTSSAQVYSPQPPMSFDATPNYSNPNQYRAPGDSCGAYFNNYIGLSKTSVVNIELLRSGSASDYFWYGGMAQRFHAPQPIQVSGAEFYAYETDSTADSIMVIVYLFDYNQLIDSLGTELARDTVYVKHTAYSTVLPFISNQAYFNSPVTVTDDYIILVENKTDDSLNIIVSSPANNDGNGEKVGYYYYNNPDWPIYTGSYLTYDFGAGWDFDAIISPRVKFELQDGFTITDDQICPNVVSAGCVNYNQMPVFSSPHYSYHNANPQQKITWLWGDGFQNTQLYNACHTYTGIGTYDITLKDTLRRFLAGNLYCGFEKTQPIYVMDGANADFTWLNNNTWITFTNTSTNADSVLWDFGDSTYSTVWDAFHIYDSVATYDVTLIAYGECGNDTTVISVTTDDVGIEDYDFNFSFYPNPANNNVMITGLVEGSQIELVNILGETVQRNISTGTSISLSTYDLSNGTYFVRVSTDYGQVTKKLMIRH